MTEPDGARATTSTKFDEIDLGAVLTYAAQADSDEVTPFGAAIEALVARCAGAIDGEEPPTPTDVRRGWRHPATAILLFGRRFVQVLKADEPPATAASAAHLGMCLLLAYVQGDDRARASWLAATAKDEWAEDDPRDARCTFADDDVDVEPVGAPLGDHLRAQVQAGSEDGRAPPRLREIARRAYIGLLGNDAVLLNEFDGLLREVERGGLAYRIDRKPKPGRFYCRKARGCDRLHLGDEPFSWTKPGSGQRFVTLQGPQGRLFMALATGRVPAPRDRHVRSDLQKALLNAGSTLEIDGTGDGVYFKGTVDLDSGLLKRWKQIRP